MSRGVDLVGASLGLVLTAPAWILVPLAIKLDDGGPVFYGQERVGRGGGTFRSWKFRTMGVSPPAGAVPHAALEAERVTRVGRIIRPTALDELPQLLNILRGDMSLVGPRALAPVQVVDGEGTVERLKDLPGFPERQSVRPGLTGLAQTRLPADAPLRNKVRYDLLYVRRRSVALDLRLIVRSVWISLRGAWPRVGRGRGRAPDR